MKRREFIRLIGGAASLPFAAHAQQTMPVIGFLDSGARIGMDANLAGFHHGLAEMEFTEGRNLAIEYRWAQGQYEQLPALAAELVRKPSPSLWEAAAPRRRSRQRVRRRASRSCSRPAAIRSAAASSPA